MPQARRPQAKRPSLWRCAAFAVAITAFAYPAANAKDSSASIKEAEQQLANGNLKAAEIELRNAIRESPQDPIIRARLAEVYLQLGDNVAAEREARAAREHSGNEADYLPPLADALLRQGKFADLVDLVPPGERNPSLESKVRLALGIAAAGMRDRDKAEAMLRDAVRLDPDAVKPKIGLARFLAGKDPDEANKLIDEAIAADPRSVDALVLKGDFLRARGDRDGAMRLFDQAFQIDPKNVRVRLSRADTNLSQDKFQAADEDLDAVLKAAPNDFTANYLRALELAKKQDYAAADRIMERISPGFANFWAGYYVQGATKVALGQFAQGESILAKYLGHVPADQRAARLIAKAALQQHAARRAIDYLKPLAEKSPVDAATLMALGEAYMADGKPELALQQFEKAAVLEPENPRIKTGVAISEINAGQGQLGLAQLEQVFASEEGATLAGPTLVLNELRAGHADKAAAVAASLVKRDANNALYQTLLGVVRAVQRDNAGAETAYRAALARDPQFSAASRNLAQLYVATERAADAKKLYTDLLSKNANDVAALLGLADLEIADKKWPEAIATINRARTAARDDPAPGLKLVGLYELHQDWNNAKAVATELSAQFPQDVNVLDALGRAQLRLGDTDGAISSYKRAYALAPDSVSIRSRYISLLYSAKYYREVRAVLQEAIDREPRNASLIVALIRVEAELDGLDAALNKAHGFAKDDPDNDVYNLVSAELAEKMGRVGDAAALLEEAIAARPSDALTIALANLYTRTGDLTKAEAVLSTRSKADPKNPAIGSALARLYLTTGRTDAAKKLYTEVLSQRPNDVAALVGLGEIAVADKKWPEATDYITRARTAAPNDPAPGLMLVNMYGLRQDWKSAVPAAAELAEKFPQNVDVLDAQGKVQVASGDKTGALATYKRAHEFAANSVPILYRYVGLLNDAKNFPEVQTVLQGALDRDPQNTSLKADLIRNEVQISGLDAAIAKAQRFAKNDPDNSIYDVVSAEIYEKAGRGKDAVALLNKAAAARPADAGLAIALSRTYIRTDDLAKAEAVLTARLQADPTNISIRTALAGFYLEQKKYDAAIAEYQRVVADRPADAAALNNLAWLFQQKGDLAKARELAERAFAAAPAAPQIDDTLGWILLAQGEADKAMTYLSAANSAAPRNPDIQYHLAVALHRVGRPTDAQAMLETLLGSGVAFTDKDEAEKLLRQLKHG